MDTKQRPKPIMLCALIGILCLLIFAGLVFWQYQKPERKSDANEQNQTQNVSSENAQSSDNNDIVPNQPLSKADDFYLQGSKELTNKNYSEAIKYFDQAIAENPYEPQYYSDKSGAQYNLGQKNQAIETLKQGSSLNPDSDLLQSKLDVLTKDQFSDPSAEVIRE